MKDEGLLVSNHIPYSFQLYSIQAFALRPLTLDFQTMQNPSLDLMEFIERNILPRYAAFDKAHQMQHVTHVVRASVKLANQLGADVDICHCCLSRLGA